MITHVDPDTGVTYVVTAYHVVEEQTQGITVTAEDEGNVREYDASVHTYDPVKDTALLSICCSTTFQAAELSEGLPETGALVFAIGYGEHRWRASISWGTVVGVRTGSGQIGINANVVEGDSGGPLIDEDGRVAGIILSVVARSRYDVFGFPGFPVHAPWPVGTGVAIGSQDALRSLGFP